MAVTLSHHFADELPELALERSAAEAPAPRLLALNQPLAAELGLDAEWLRTDDGVRFLVGNAVPDGARPVAQAYAGHQFGGYSPRLGDGRALLLGEVTDAGGRLRDVHLKGSGRTPFARGGDGLAAVGPMLREYVVSEAMHALGIPTTRSLAVVATGRTVQRDTPLPGAVLTRVASSHLRVGTFQYVRALDDPALLRRLVDHAIARHHPHAADADRPALALFEAVVAAQADLVARWMLVGFVHGVMNTDNMTISGETIDYGPCAFLEAFDPSTVFSSIDSGGRYAYANQPLAAEWNLARLAETLLPLVHDDEAKAVEVVTAALEGFRPRYAAAWDAGWRAKLGLDKLDHRQDELDHRQDELDQRDEVVTGLLTLLQTEHPDLTSFVVALADGTARDHVVDREAFDTWHARWQALGPDVEAMRRTNPVRVPRNHLVQEALDAADDGDLTHLEPLLRAVTSPYGDLAGAERYAEPSPDGADAFVTYCGT